MSDDRDISSFLQRTVLDTTRYLRMHKEDKAYREWEEGALGDGKQEQAQFLHRRKAWQRSMAEEMDLMLEDGDFNIFRIQEDSGLLARRAFPQTDKGLLDFMREATSELGVPLANVYIINDFSVHLLGAMRGEDGDISETSVDVSLRFTTALASGVMPHDVAKAMVAHEYGHLMLPTFDEYEADDYAAQKYSPQKMAEALRMASAGMGLKEKTEENILSDYPPVYQRIDALLQHEQRKEHGDGRNR